MYKYLTALIVLVWAVGTWALDATKPTNSDLLSTHAGYIRETRDYANQLAAPSTTEFRNYTSIHTENTNTGISVRNGSKYVYISDLSTAATSVNYVGKTIYVSSPQVISVAISWPTDRELKFESGGYVTFTGSGTLTGLNEARPEYFGVDGTDDNVQLTQALTAANTVILTPGHPYYAGAVVAIPSGKTILGNGATWKRKTGSGVYDLFQNSDQASGNTDIRIENLIIDGNRTADGLVAANAGDRFSGIRFTKVSGKSSVSGCTVTGTVNNETGGGIYLDTCNNVLIEKNILTSNDRSGIVHFTNSRCIFNENISYSNLGSGITGNDNTDCHYTGNITYSNGSGGTYTGMNASGSGALITGNTSYSNTGSGITIGDGTGDGSRSTLSANRCYSNTLDGITISGVATDVTVSGNVLTGNTRRGIWVGPNSARCMVANNIIFSNDGHGVFLDAGSNHIVTGNQIYLNGLSGVYVDTTGDNTQVLGNTIYNNGRITTGNSSGVTLNTVTHCRIEDNRIYDDQGISATQESSIWVAGGSENVVSNNTIYPTKTNYIRETSSPVYSDFRNKIGSNGFTGTFYADAGTSTVVSNNNAKVISRIKIWPTNAAAVAKGLPYIQTLTVGTSFTLIFPSAMAGGNTESYAYEIQ